MPQHPFAALERRLIDEGIAVRHVRRYVGELQTHLHEITESERNAGASREEARAAALRRLGSEEVLVQAMLARPELRALSARFPALVFGLGPLAALAMIVACALLAEAAIVFAAPEFGTASLWRMLFNFLNAFVVYGAPMVIALALIATGLRQRIPSGWIVLGLGVICVAGSFHHLGIVWSSAPDMPSELSLSFGLIPPFPEALIAGGLVRLLLNASLAAGFWMLLQHPTMRRF